jgi:hypothetical protein
MPKHTKTSNNTTIKERDETKIPNSKRRIDIIKKKKYIYTKLSVFKTLWQHKCVNFEANFFILSNTCRYVAKITL